MGKKQKGCRASREAAGSSIRPNVIEVGRLYYMQDLNDEYSRTIAICVGSENARLVERALNALRSNTSREAR